MHRDGVSDIDGLILKLSKIVPVLQIESLGRTADEICGETHRQLDLGLDPAKTVFKIPVSLEAVKACYQLRRKGLLVNVHLVYTPQQAYMAMHAGATYVCPLVGRLQDQGQDALEVVRQCVDAVARYKYDTKVMFSSVRHAEHVRNALSLGVHTITAPWKIIKQLTENHFTTVGTHQFIEHTRLMTVRVRNAIRETNPIVEEDARLSDAIVKMTEFGFGAVTVVDAGGRLIGVFTDGDLRRMLSANGRDVLNRRMLDFSYRAPIAVEADALLNDAAELFKKTNVDTILVTQSGAPIGMLDIQDLKEDYARGASE